MSTIDLAARRRHRTTLAAPCASWSQAAASAGAPGTRRGKVGFVAAPMDEPAHQAITQATGAGAHGKPQATGPGLAEVIVINVPRGEFVMSRPPLRATAFLAAVTNPRSGSRTHRSVVALAARSALNVPRSARLTLVTIGTHASEHRFDTEPDTDLVASSGTSVGLPRLLAPVA
jgi:hypothetical protein